MIQQVSVNEISILFFKKLMIIDMIFTKKRLNIILLICLSFSSIISSSAVFLLDDPNADFYIFKTVWMMWLLFPGFIVSSAVAYLLARCGKIKSAFLVLFILPLCVQLLVEYHFNHGDFPHNELPKYDYRHFRRTEAEPLIEDIVRNKNISGDYRKGINYQESYSGMTPLLFCLRNGYYKAANDLLDMGADPNVVDCKNGISPLGNVCLMLGQDQNLMKKELFVKLLDKGANPNWVADKKSPLMILCSHSVPNKAALSLLIAYGAEVNYKNVQDDEYLHDCYKENESALNMVIYSGNYSVAMYLIEQGADTLGYRDWMLDQMARNRGNSNVDVDRNIECQLNSYLRSCK